MKNEMYVERIKKVLQSGAKNSTVAKTLNEEGFALMTHGHGFYLPEGYVEVDGHYGAQLPVKKVSLVFPNESELGDFCYREPFTASVIPLVKECVC